MRKVHTSVDIPEDLHQRVKASGMTLLDLIERGVEASETDKQMGVLSSTEQEIASFQDQIRAHYQAHRDSILDLFERRGVNNRVKGDLRRSAERDMGVMFSRAEQRVFFQTVEEVYNEVLSSGELQRFVSQKDHQTKISDAIQEFTRIKDQFNNYAGHHGYLHQIKTCGPKDEILMDLSQNFVSAMGARTSLTPDLLVCALKHQYGLVG